MRLVFAVAMILTLAVGAHAQSSMNSRAPGPPPPPPKSQQEIQAERSAERAYKDSLKNIPDQPPADPWGNARSVDGATAAKSPKATKPPTKAGSASN
jgi:hypothetical protein